MVLKKKSILFIVLAFIVLILGSYAYYRLRLRKKEISGFMQSSLLKEISGIASSGIFEDIYYVHNDSGDTSRFFAITPKGKLVSTFYYKDDRSSAYPVLDCEDIAVGKGPKKDKSYVYLGDIGDNFNWRPYITIYRFEEQASWMKDSVNNVVPAQLHLTYPDWPKDSEAMMIDPIGDLLYIVNKRTDTVKIYTTPLNFTDQESRKLTLRGKLLIPGFKPFKYVTAGDISKDGTRVLLKTYGKVYYWKRKGNEPIWQTMQEKPHELPYELQRQGEAIGFTPDGQGYYTTSEAAFAAIYFYRIP